MVSERKVHTLGSRFSQDVHGIITKPKQAVHTIIEESDLPHSLSVPLFVVIIAAIMSAIGTDLWGHIFFATATTSVILQTLSAIWSGLKLTFRIFYNSFAFLLIWVMWSVVFHLIGSIVSVTDITRKRTFWTTLKLTGFMFAPLFFNVFPRFDIITGYWSAYIAYHGMKANYETTGTGALIITLPYLFSVVFGTFLLVKALLGF